MKTKNVNNKFNILLLLLEYNSKYNSKFISLVYYFIDHVLKNKLTKA